MTADIDHDSHGQPRLVGSHDAATGQTYFPFRPLAADGSLRDCARVHLSSCGTLYTWTRFAGMSYGQVDLPEGVRVQTRLCDGPHAIGADYRLEVNTDGWRFCRD